jgi:hypothetical protein
VLMSSMMSLQRSPPKPVATDSGGNQLAFMGISRGNKLTGGPRWLVSTYSNFNTAAAAVAHYALAQRFPNLGAA